MFDKWKCRIYIGWFTKLNRYKTTADTFHNLTVISTFNVYSLTFDLFDYTNESV